MSSKFCHDSFHRVFIFLEEKTQLLVFVSQGLVLDDHLRIQSLELTVKKLYDDEESAIVQRAVCRIIPFDISTFTRRSEKPAVAFVA